MANWLRDYRILAGVPGRDGFVIGDFVEGRAIHVHFSLEKSDSESGNTGTLTISNLSREHKGILNEKGCVVEIRAGYMGSLNTIFIGGVEETTETLTNADRDLEISLIDGFSNFDKPVSVSLNDVVTCGTALEFIKEQMGIESVLITERAAERLEAAKYDNGYCHVGKGKAAIHNLCQKSGTTFTLQDGVLQIYVQGEGVTEQLFVLNAASGLISIPKKITISETGTGTAAHDESGDSTIEKGIPGYEVEYFLNGSVGINDLIKLESSVISGVFRIQSITYEGDNYNGDWKCISKIVEVM